ncbi:MAG: histidine phosphatase family protein [Eubacteriaceae bacterium]|nr:histidine phosphatase family protein [Eubacteriaceae bacterium]
MQLAIQLIRHGLTQANIDRLYCGSTDIGLCLEGLEMLKQRTNSNIYHQTQVYFTSGMARTNETLKALFGDVDYRIVTEMSECDFGIFEMKRHEELESSQEYQDWINDPTGDYQVPEGESQNYFRNRVLTGFNNIVAIAATEKFASCTVVAHGGTIGVLALDMFPRPEDIHLYDTVPAHGGGYLVEISVGEDGSSFTLLGSTKIP